MIILSSINIHSPVLNTYAKTEGNILLVRRSYKYYNIFVSKPKIPNTLKFSKH